MPEATSPSPHPAFQGISTFLSTPQAETASDLGRLEADVAIIGAPVDMGVMNRPRAISQASNFGSDHHDIYHIGLGVHPLEALRVADFGWAWLKYPENKQARSPHGGIPDWGFPKGGAAPLEGV